MGVGEGLHGRWNPFVRSTHKTNVFDPLSKLASNERQRDVLTTDCTFRSLAVSKQNFPLTP